MMLLLVGFFCALCVNAIPAKRGMWRTIKLKNGKKVSVELRGDEHGHFLADRNGNAYVLNDKGTYDKTTIDVALNGDVGSMRRNLKEQARKFETERLRKSPRKAQGIPEDKSKFLGKKKGLVILAQFNDVEFSITTPGQFGCSSINALYDKIINTRDLDMEPFYGSVRDYFLEQSDGKFELEFDVVGPVTLEKNRAYYGDNYIYSKKGNKYTANDYEEDVIPTNMVYEAINKVTTKADGTAVNFSDYDWDSDGEAEVVYVIYAGQGEADGGSEETVWPHKFTLSSGAQLLSNLKRYYGRSYYIKSGNNYILINNVPAISSITKNNTKIDTYACSNELATNQTYISSSNSYRTNGTQLNGIGTICHEFSHTMGYPDMYDVASENYGMGYWDLMNSGSYNGTWNGGNSSWSAIDAGYRPCGYTAFERWCAGWLEPIELTDPQKITKMKPLGGTRDGGAADHGEAYVVYMPNSQKNIKGEYYLLENREWANWDYDVPWFGLLVYYVHYNENLWSYNVVNCTNSTKLGSYGLTNSHARMAVFQAAGPDPGYLSLDAYPYNINYLPQIVNSSYGSTAEEIINTLNSRFGTNGLALNTSTNRALDNTTTPLAYYYGTGSTKQTLTDHEIWNIMTNGDDARTVSFIYRKPSERVLNLDQDATTAPSFVKGLYTSVTSNKPLTAGSYNTLWFPFDMSAAEVHSYLGDNAEVYRLSDIRADERGIYEVVVTEDTKNGIKAYEPVFVKLDGGSTAINIDYYMQVNNTLSEKEPVVELANGWKMVGTTTYDYVPTGDYFIGTSNGEQKFYKSKGTSKLRAYRAYFIAPTNGGMNASSANLSYALSAKRDVKEDEVENDIRPIDLENRVFVMLGPDDEEDDVDGISPVFKVVNHSDDGAIFNMKGQKVGDASKRNSLPKGVYVANGKKFVVK